MNPLYLLFAPYVFARWVVSMISDNQFTLRRRYNETVGEFKTWYDSVLLSSEQKVYPWSPALANTIYTVGELCFWLALLVPFILISLVVFAVFGDLPAYLFSLGGFVFTLVGSATSSPEALALVIIGLYVLSGLSRTLDRYPVKTPETWHRAFSLVVAVSSAVFSLLVVSVSPVTPLEGSVPPLVQTLVILLGAGVANNLAVRFISVASGETSAKKIVRYGQMFVFVGVVVTLTGQTTLGLSLLAVSVFSLATVSSLFLYLFDTDSQTQEQRGYFINVEQVTEDIVFSPNTPTDEVQNQDTTDATSTTTSPSSNNENPSTLENREATSNTDEELDSLPGDDEIIIEVNGEAASVRAENTDFVDPDTRADNIPENRVTNPVQDQHLDDSGFSNK